MKNSKGIALIKVVLLTFLIIGIIYFFVSRFFPKEIKWGYMPPSEYYELCRAIAESALYDTNSLLYGKSVGEEGEISLASFNTLGRYVKRANGRWFSRSDVNFRGSVEHNGLIEEVSITDGEHIAIFSFVKGSDYVTYTYKKGSGAGYRIIIK